MKMPVCAVPAACLVVATLTWTPARAQLRRPSADVTPIVDTKPVRPGGTAQVSLKVRLPENVHVQSDKPRDPSLIPTALTLEPPSGITLAAITYPPATDLKQAGRKQPLAVFEREFTIAIRLNVAADIPAGDHFVNGRLRYQACDATLCYPPTRANASWTLRVDNHENTKPIS